MKAAYQGEDRADSRAVAEFFSGEGSLFVPLLQLIENAEPVVDELIATAGRATIEAVRTHSAQQVAGRQARLLIPARRCGSDWKLPLPYPGAPGRLGSNPGAPERLGKTASGSSNFRRNEPLEQWGTPMALSAG